MLLLLGFFQFMDPMAAFDALVVLYFVAVPLAYYWALRVGAPTNVSLTLVAMLLLVSGVSSYLDLPAVAVFVGVAALVAGAYVYAVPEICAYYRALQRDLRARVSTEDSRRSARQHDPG